MKKKHGILICWVLEDAFHFRLGRLVGPTVPKYNIFSLTNLCVCSSCSPSPAYACPLCVLWLHFLISLYGCLAAVYDQCVRLCAVTLSDQPVQSQKPHFSTSLCSHILRPDLSTLFCKQSCRLAQRKTMLPPFRKITHSQSLDTLSVHPYQPFACPLLVLWLHFLTSLYCCLLSSCSFRSVCGCVWLHFPTSLYVVRLQKPNLSFYTFL